MGNQNNLWNDYQRRFLKIVFGFLECIVQFLFGLVYGGKKEAMPPITDLMLLESASSIALKIRTKKITCEQVLDSFITRIAEVNPVLNCVVADRFDDARKEAQAADQLIKSGTMSEQQLEKEKPFLGVPFTTKDCIAVKGLIHSSGLFCRKHIRAEEDAAAIKRLRQAGAIPIGLTNVSELCMWWESANNIHGRTNNPYDVSRIVGGSSGGEGCAQACAASAFGVGSDIGGSIRMPAFFNGIFGHMPTPLSVPLSGQYPSPVSEEQERFLRIGPMCRRAEDLLPLLKVMTNNLPALRLDDPVDIKNIKFHYQESDGGSKMISAVQPDIRELFGRVCLHLEKAHNIKANKVSLKRFIKSAPMWFANMKSPNGPTFAEQLTNLEGKINPWWELVKWTFRQSNHSFVALATCLIEKGGCRYGDEKYQYLVEERDAFRLEVLDLLGDDGVLLYPTHPTSAPYHHEPLVKPFNFAYTGVINVLKLPATHIPMGLDRNGLPIGLQVISKENNDRLCIAVARELEKAFGGWVPPEIDA
ncbi:fatty-acid amide hydrolase 2 [Anthonomus grandis grandis]|uniref:fatty-acid amide hydrolase 2 n=1 Tax=Anthonomus grandis grandis TaxID=2921223 RepID=UPI0021657571|nr:fatty-acid amide hydrolase 2 [Anthonomus grandis grandis]